jgi:transcriptional regulator with XRE-family HTH domain
MAAIDKSDETPLTTRIRQELNARNWYVRDLERAAGLKERTVLSILERKSKNPRVDTIQKIAKALGCSIGELLGEPPTPTPEIRSLVFRMILSFLKFNRDGGMQFPKETPDTDLELIAKAFADAALQQPSHTQTDLMEAVSAAVENVADLQSLRNT